MSKIVIIGAGAMGTAFSFPCVDNSHDTTIVGTHLEDEFIENLKNNNNLHPGIKTQVSESVKVVKFEKFNSIFKSNVDLIVLGINSKGIGWVADQLSTIFKDNNLPNLLMLTKGLSVHNDKYELLVDKLKRLLKNKGILKTNISAVGGPCLAAGLSHRIHSGVSLQMKICKMQKKLLRC